jgi:hypothetical protein
VPLLAECADVGPRIANLDAFRRTAWSDLGTGVRRIAVDQDPGGCTRLAMPVNADPILFEACA